MPERLSTFAFLLFGLLAGVGLLIYFILLPATLETEVALEEPSSGHSRSNQGSDFEDGSSSDRRGAFDAMTAALELAELRRLLEQRGSIDGEAILRFNDVNAYNRFLTNAGRYGLDILGNDSRNFALRLSFEEYDSLLDGLSDYESSEYSIGANFIVSIPFVPAPDSPDNPGQNLLAFGSRTLDYLGVSNNATWGQGTAIAVLDTGIPAHSIFREGQVTTIDYHGNGEPMAENSHGLAVASEIVFVAPGSEILSYPIFDAEGNSTTFDVAAALYDTIGKVDIINASWGTDAVSPYLTQAIADVVDAGIIVIAAAGNNGRDGKLTHPAAYPDVVSVGSVDALSQRVYFSNSADGLGLTAPGWGVTAAAPDDGFTSFSGTSASAPFVTAGVASLLSQDSSMSGQEAVNLLYEYANEAGLPGPDSEYGHGIINFQRVMQRDTPGIYDVAVASQTFADPSIPLNNANRFIDVTVQNRGTEILYNVSVQVSSPGMLRNFNIPVLTPNEISVLQAPIDAAIVRSDGSLQVVTTANFSTANTFDANRRDNRQTTTISVVQAAAPAPSSDSTSTPRASGGIQ